MANSKAKSIEARLEEAYLCSEPDFDWPKCGERQNTQEIYSHNLMKKIFEDIEQDESLIKKLPEFIKLGVRKLDGILTHTSNLRICIYPDTKEKEEAISNFCINNGLIYIYTDLQRIDGKYFRRPIIKKDEARRYFFSLYGGCLEELSQNEKINVMNDFWRIKGTNFAKT